jgi:hypothetical protein
LFVTGPQRLASASDAAEARWFTPSEAAESVGDHGLARMLQKCIARGILKP